MAIGIKDFGLDGQVHPAEACAGFCFLTAAGLLAVDQNIGVMHQAFIAWPDFHGFQPARAVHRGVKHEVPVIV